MSRTYSKKRFQQAMAEGWYKEKLVGRGRNSRFVPCTEDEEYRFCKKAAAKSKRGCNGTAPSAWVTEVFEVPFRAQTKRICKKICKGIIDADEAVFVRHRRGAWWLWY